MTNRYTRKDTKYRQSSKESK